MVKIWPHSRWRHVSFTFLLSEVHQSSPPKFYVIFDLLQILSTPRIPPFQQLSSESRSSSSSPSISADGYATIYSSMFITCDVTQREHLWIMADFPTCNSNKSTSVITTVTTDRHVRIVWLWESHPYPSASMPTAQSSINRPPSPTKKGILILILDTPSKFL